MIVYSPNVQCEPAGPGRGRSGQPGMIGENCVPQGNVLIIQEDTVEYPEASFDGGMIRFDFQREAKAVYSLELMNINGNATYVTVTHSGETVVRISVVGLGRNSIQTVSINLENVSSITVTFTEPGAVTQLNGCFEPSTRPPSVIAPTLPGTTPTGAPPTQPVPTPLIGTPTQPAPTPDSTTPTQQTPTPAPPLPRHHRHQLRRHPLQVERHLHLLLPTRHRRRLRQHPLQAEYHHLQMLQIPHHHRAKVVSQRRLISMKRPTEQSFLVENMLKTNGLRRMGLNFLQ